MSETFKVSAFYHFQSLSDEVVERIQQSLTTTGRAEGIKGLVLIGAEGLNGTIAGAPASVDVFEAAIRALAGFEAVAFKNSEAPKMPFSHFKVKWRPEIVTQGTPDLVPNEETTTEDHLSADEWEKLMSSGDAVVLDTRNRYETEIGHFKGAVIPPIDTFREFPAYLQQSQFDKSKPFLIYCTGGIRCEKAALEMKRQGFDKVFQLDGGILRYFETSKAKAWEGECFVFDYRVAVDKQLQPTQNYKFCPHCGQPGKEHIACTRCDTPAQVCHHCMAREAARHSCSKNCAYHLRLKPGGKGKPSLARR